MNEYPGSLNESKIISPCNRDGVDCEKRCLGCRKTCAKWKVYQFQKRREESKKNDYHHKKTLAEIEDKKDRNKERRERIKLKEQLDALVT